MSVLKSTVSKIINYHRHWRVEDTNNINIDAIDIIERIDITESIENYWNQLPKIIKNYRKLRKFEKNRKSLMVTLKAIPWIATQNFPRFNCRSSVQRIFSITHWPRCLEIFAPLKFTLLPNPHSIETTLINRHGDHFDHFDMPDQFHCHRMNLERALLSKVWQWDYWHSVAELPPHCFSATEIYCVHYPHSLRSNDSVSDVGRHSSDIKWYQMIYWYPKYRQRKQ